MSVDGKCLKVTAKIGKRSPGPTPATWAGSRNVSKGFSGPFDGVFCPPWSGADCLEGGGKALFDRYNGVIEELDFGDPLRTALETSILGGMAKLSFDTAGRITLPETLCEMFGLTDWVTVVGLGDRFQIWERGAFNAYRAAQRDAARQGLAQLRAQQRAARLGGAA